MSQTQYIRSTDVEDRASWARRVLWRIEAMAWDWLYWFPVSKFRAERASDIGAKIGRWIGPRLKQHKVAKRNLALAFPDWSPSQIDAVAREAWENVGRTAGELPHLPSIDPYAADGRVDVIGAHHLDAIEASAEGAVLVSGHFANWEVMAAVICNRPVDCLVTYRAINNPHIDKRLNKVRHDYGIGVLTPKGLGTRTLMKALGDGRAVALMNDQKFREGLAVPFFGHAAMTAPGPARLALRYGVPIVPVSTVRTGPARFRVTIHEPLQIKKGKATPGDVQAVVEAITRFIEDRVREVPGQWFWMHRRWPKSANRPTQDPPSTDATP